MKSPALWTLILLFASPISAQTGFLDRSVHYNGEIWRYQVYVPLEFTTSRDWPVIVALHGTGPQGTDGMRHTNSDFANSVRRNRDLFPTVIVFPQAHLGKGIPPEVFNAQLNETLREFRGDSTRVYLVGYSAGAFGAYRIAYRQPGRFAGIVAVAGSIVLGDKFPAQMVERDRRENSFVADPDPYSSFAERVSRIPFWILHGKKDNTVPIEEAHRVRDALLKAGATVRYTEYTDSTHVGSSRAAHSDTAVIGWLLRQHRD
jgi:predicted peptidase